MSIHYTATLQSAGQTSTWNEQQYTSSSTTMDDEQIKALSISTNVEHTFIYAY